MISPQVDLVQLRQITQDQHNRFIRSNGLNDGLFLSAKTGENVVKAFYKAASEAIGIQLTSGELAMYDKVLKVHVDKTADEGRTEFANDIEREDLEAEKRKQQQEAIGSDCKCVIS